MMIEKALWAEDFTPRPGECVASIAVRLAPHGRLTPRELIRYALNMPNRPLARLPASINGIERLAQLGGLQVEELAPNAWIETPAGYRILGREVPESWVETSRRRIAPGALARDGDEPYIRTLWQISALACDPDTGEALRSRCWNCSSGLTWQETRTIYECPCGADQREAPVRRVPEDVLVNSQELAGFFGYGPSPRLPAPFSSLPEPALFHLLGWFGYFSELREGAQLRPSAVNAARGYRAFKRWPASFDAILAATLMDYANPPEAASVSVRTRTMGQLMSAVARAGSPEAVAILRERAERVLGVNCNAIAGLHKIYGPDFRPEYKSIAPPTGQTYLSLGSRTQPAAAMRPTHRRVRPKTRSLER